MRVALVTAASARHLDEDLPPLAAALAEAGAEARVEVWDEPGVDWAAFDLVVVRSTWDYVARRDELLAWAEGVAAVTALVNPPDVLRWNTDKHYLADLAAAGVATIPTAFVRPGDPIDLPGLGIDLDGDVVVKPAIGAGSVDTERYAPSRRADVAAHVERLVSAGRTAIVQPYLEAVDDHGETALVYFAGRFSHAVRKGPILRADGTVFVEGLYAEEQISARTSTEAEQAVAHAALAAVPNHDAADLLYARVDVVPGSSGEPLVLELELAEPSVFVALAAGAAERFADAIVEHARRRRR